MKTLLFLLITTIGFTNHQNGMELEIPVQSHTAVYETVVEQIPYESCWIEKVPARTKSKFNLGGAIIGGLIGSKIGKGNGKKAATILGALLASGVTKRRDAGYYTKEQRCETRYKQNSKKVLTGYTHHLTILGQSYDKFYTYKKDKVNIFLNIQFPDDMIVNTVVQEPIRVVQAPITYPQRSHRYPRSSRRKYSRAKLNDH
ncbi:MAG: hypothetical protein COB02_01945 [Candidatus Cloacimonadota bacterium]|nr:MAG: hypothetical protein COB02_01945 [Candidatus Cloacimonadota bacterium]